MRRAYGAEDRRDAVRLDQPVLDLGCRGHSDRLFKRDFAGEMMDRHPQLQLIDYGFAYETTGIV